MADAAKSNPVGSPETAYGELLTVLRGRGLAVHPAIEFATTKCGFGGVATRPIPAGSDLMSVPYPLVLTETRAAQRPLAQALRRALGPAFSGLESRTMLFAELVALRFTDEYHWRAESAEKRLSEEEGAVGGRSEDAEWRAYARALPAEYDDPLQWPQDQADELLRGTNLAAATSHRRGWLRRQFRLLESACAEEPAALPGHVFTWERMLWAQSAFSSRGFPHFLAVPPGVGAASLTPADEAAVGCMVPALDILNHDAAARVRWERRSDRLCFVTEEALPAGAEVCNNYGPKSNEELLLCFGFVVPNNPSDAAAVTLSAPGADTDPLAPLRRRVARAASLIRPRMYITKDDPLPAELLAAAVVGAADEAALEAWLDLAWDDAAAAAASLAGTERGPAVCASGPASSDGCDEVVKALRSRRRADDPLTDFDHPSTRLSAALLAELVAPCRRRAVPAGMDPGRAAAAAGALAGLLRSKAALAEPPSREAPHDADESDERMPYRRKCVALYRQSQAALFTAAAEAAEAVAHAWGQLAEPGEDDQERWRAGRAVATAMAAAASTVGDGAAAAAAVATGASSGAAGGGAAGSRAGSGGPSPQWAIELALAAADTSTKGEAPAEGPASRKRGRAERAAAEEAVVGSGSGRHAAALASSLLMRAAADEAAVAGLLEEAVVLGSRPGAGQGGWAVAVRPPAAGAAPLLSQWMQRGWEAFEASEQAGSADADDDSEAAFEAFMRGLAAVEAVALGVVATPAGMQNRPSPSPIARQLVECLRVHGEAEAAEPGGRVAVSPPLDGDDPAAAAHAGLDGWIALRGSPKRSRALAALGMAESGGAAMDVARPERLACAAGGPGPAVSGAIAEGDARIDVFGVPVAAVPLLVLAERDAASQPHPAAKRLARADDVQPGLKAWEFGQMTAAEARLPAFYQAEAECAPTAATMKEAPPALRHPAWERSNTLAAQAQSQRLLQECVGACRRAQLLSVSAVAQALA